MFGFVAHLLLTLFVLREAKTLTSVRKKKKSKYGEGGGPVDLVVSRRDVADQL